VVVDKAVSLLPEASEEVMPGWGEAKGSGSVGTTGQIEEAHRELDEIGIPPGPLAARAVKAVVLIAYLKKLGKKNVVDL
jgi:hypothetical protein